MAFTNLGNMYTTKGVHEKMKGNLGFMQFIVHCLERYQKCDWGDLDDEDKQMNDDAVKNGNDRVLAKYEWDEDTSIYIITEWDRSATTVLFPEEY